jgi:hypothetical protein
MRTQVATYSAVAFVRRGVDGFLRGDCRGRFVCSGCLVKLTRDHLDKSCATSEIVRMMDHIFTAPSPIAHAPASTCAVCARTNRPCLGVPLPNAVMPLPEYSYVERAA